MTNSTLSKQVILITGASTGIGAALAKSLAAQYSGIRLVITARNQAKLEQIANQCQEVGADVFVIPADMADTQQIQALAQKAIAHFGRVDAVVNNAGYGQMGPMELVPPEAAKQQFAVNFHGPLTLIQSLIPGMRAQGGGKIINISSLGGKMAFPAGGMYSASKFALEALSDVLRMELKAFNIRVSVIEPGPVKTQFFDVAREKIQISVPEAGTTPYRAAFEKVEQLKQQTERLGWTSEKVAQVIIHALKSRHPRPRYIAASGGNILLFLMTKVLPTWMTDAFWKRFYGIDRVEKEWKSKLLERV